MNALLVRGLTAAILFTGLASATAQPTAPKKEDAAKKDVPPAKKDVPVVKKEEPVAKKEVPVVKKEEPVAKKEVPMVKKEEPVAKKEEPAGKKEESVTLQLKTFEIKTANSTEIQTFLMKEFGAPTQPVAVTPTVPGKTHHHHHMLVAVEPQSKTLFVRGTAAELDAAEKIIALLDVAADKADKADKKGALALPYIIHLHHANAETVIGVLKSLELDTGVQTSGMGHILIVPASNSNVEQIKQVIERVGAGKPTTKSDIAPKPASK